MDQQQQDVVNEDGDSSITQFCVPESREAPRRKARWRAMPQVAFAKLGKVEGCRLEALLPLAPTLAPRGERTGV